MRFLKDLVFDGVPVIFIAVPHRAYDAVRVEKEMTGRVKLLDVGFWTEEELTEIALTGFHALNISDELSITSILAEESFKSPYLMQDFCKGLCRDLGISKTMPERLQLQDPPQGWPEFFKRRSSAASKTAFDRLARGPRQRTDRKARRRKDGTDVDIYGATLAAIAHTGPLTSVTYEQLRSSFREVLASEVPQRHEITRVLEEMSKIARQHIPGEPIVDYDEEMSTLHISDPYFAYYLKWGPQGAVELN
ncbi:hypothetical protein [Saccharomonospora azurea]|uniref:hypothetical protein n=1 Tax=Saccharomonospora azurea TaxID=40988 RepID=UPI0011472EBC|nr:hypothetical protein [Saccharomonospora azurea]